MGWIGIFQSVSFTPALTITRNRLCFFLVCYQQQCFKILPYVAGVMFLLVVAFALWIRSIPPKVIEQPQQPKVQINEQSFVPPDGLADSGIKVDVASSSSGSGPDVELKTETVTEEVVQEEGGDDGTRGEEDVTEL